MRSFLLFLPFAALAAGGPSDGIPAAVAYQALNVVVVFAILFIFGRKPLAQMLIEKKEQYLSSLSKAQEARKKAETEYEDIKSKLQKLKSEEASSLESARTEAKVLEENIVKSAQESAQFLKSEAEKLAQVELDKAKRTLTEEMLSTALQTARTSLKSEMKPEDQSRLQEDFSSRLRVVE